MEVNNGIIIDGVLHEMIKSIVPDTCKTCSLHEQCDRIENSGGEWLCNIFNCYGFTNRGKVKVENVRILKTCIKDKNKTCNLCHECDVCISNPTCSNY